MIRYKVGERILVRRADLGADKQIEVRILNKIPNYIKVEVLSSGWFSIGSIQWLCTASWSSEQWYSLGKVPNEDDL